MQRAGLTQLMFIAASSLHSLPAQVKEGGGEAGGEVKRCGGGDEERLLSWAASSLRLRALDCIRWGRMTWVT